MAEINLLKQTGSSQDFINVFPKVLVWLFVFVLLGLITYYVWLVFKVKETEKLIGETQAKIVTENADAEKIDNRFELYTRQTQIAGLEDLISKHVYWSQIFPVLAKATLKNATYTTLKGNMDGSLEMTVTVPTIPDLEKFMQVFDISKYNENFSKVRIGGYSKVQGKNGTSIQFQVKMDYKPELIQYKAGN